MLVCGGILHFIGKEIAMQPSREKVGFFEKEKKKRETPIY